MFLDEKGSANEKIHFEEDRFYFSLNFDLFLSIMTYYSLYLYHYELYHFELST